MQEFRFSVHSHHGGRGVGAVWNLWSGALALEAARGNLLIASRCGGARMRVCGLSRRLRASNQIYSLEGCGGREMQASARGGLITLECINELRNLPEVVISTRASLDPGLAAASWRRALLRRLESSQTHRRGLPSG